MSDGGTLSSRRSAGHPVAENGQDTFPRRIDAIGIAVRRLFGPADPADPTGPHQTEPPRFWWRV